MNSNKGITLVSLVITIIIMSILSVTATYSGITTINYTKKKAFTTELKTIETKVDVYAEKGVAAYQNLGILVENAPVTEQQKNAILASKDIGITSFDGYRYFYEGNYDSIELSGIKQEVFVNFETRSVISVKGFEYQGAICYSLKQLGEDTYSPEYMGNKNIGTPTFDIKMEPLDTRWKVIATNIQYAGDINKGTLYYRLKGKDTWEEARDLAFETKEPGIYELQLIDKAENKSEIKQAYAYVKDGLLLYYDAQNNTGSGYDKNATTWKDLSGNANDGILHNFNGNSSSGWTNNYLKFDGVNDSVETTNALAYNQSKSTTVEFVDVDGASAKVSKNTVLFETSVNSNNNKGAFYIDTREYGIKDLTYAAKYSGVKNHKMVNGILTEKTKSYTLSCDTRRAVNQNIKIYGNGKNQQVVEILNQDITDLPLDDYKLYIGSRANTTLFTSMNLGTVRVYNRALTDEEIRINYAIDKVKFNIVE